jgi:hypothetical protein
MEAKNLLIGFRKVVTLLLMVVIVVLYGCKDDPEPIVGTTEADIPKFTVVNLATKLTDKSNNATSRTWTIQDGTPATSTDRVVDVVFGSKGTKSIKLDVVFDNGTKNSATFTIDVSEELNATIASTQTLLFAKGDKDIKVSLKFSAAVVGEPDGYAWTFPGGTPATSTEASPTVVWTGGGTPAVSLKITRSKDAATLTKTATIEVGPKNLWTNSFWGFEADDVIANLQTWDGDKGAPWAGSVVTALGTGFDGKAIEINYPGNTGYYGVISRDKTPSNAKLKLGDIVLFSYYAKVAVAGSKIGFARIVNHIPSWWEGNPPTGFEGFTAAQAQDYQFWANIEPVDNIGTDWTRISKIDTLDNLNYAEGKNVFPEFGFSGNPGRFSIDKVELKRLGSIN